VWLRICKRGSSRSGEEAPGFSTAAWKPRVFLKAPVDSIECFVAVESAIGHQAMKIGITAGRFFIGKFKGHRSPGSTDKAMRNRVGSNLSAETLGVFLDDCEFCREIIRVELTRVASDSFTVDFKIADTSALRLMRADQLGRVGSGH
jgi:hypothetical protein